MKLHTSWPQMGLYDSQMELQEKNCTHFWRKTKIHIWGFFFVSNYFMCTWHFAPKWTTHWRCVGSDFKKHFHKICAGALGSYGALNMSNMTSMTKWEKGIPVEKRGKEHHCIFLSNSIRVDLLFGSKNPERKVSIKGALLAKRKLGSSYVSSNHFPLEFADMPPDNS